MDRDNYTLHPSTSTSSSSQDYSSQPSTSTASSSSWESSSDGDTSPSPRPRGMPTFPPATRNKVIVENAEQVLEGQVLDIDINFINKDKDLTPEVMQEFMSGAMKVTKTAQRIFARKNLKKTCSHGVHMPGSPEEMYATQEKCNCWVMFTMLIGLIPLLTTTMYHTLVLPESTPTAPPPPSDNEKKDRLPGKQYTDVQIMNMSDAPRIFPRTFWCAQPPADKLEDLLLPATKVVVCHTATDECATTPACRFSVRNIQDFHIDCRGWPDIGYHFLIGGDGNVYTGRGWNFQGAHTKGHNVGSLGIAFIGTFIKTMPNKTMIEAFHKLIAIGVKAGKISPQYVLVAHCQLTQTASPGLTLARNMHTWPHYDNSLPLQCPPGLGHVGE